MIITSIVFSIQETSAFEITLSPKICIQPALFYGIKTRIRNQIIYCRRTRKSTKTSTGFFWIFSMPSAVDTGNFFLFELCLIRVNHSHHKILCCTVICNFKHLLIEKLDAHCKFLNSNWPWEIVCVVVEFPLFPHKCPHIFLDMEVASHMRHHWFKLIHIISVKDSLNGGKKPRTSDI